MLPVREYTPGMPHLDRAAKLETNPSIQKVPMSDPLQGDRRAIRISGLGPD